MRNLTFIFSSFLIISNSFSSTKYRQIEDVPELYSVPKDKIMKVQEVISRHGGGTPRPESCPLESEKNIDILTKINNIKTLFKDNCLDNNQNRMEEILQGAQNIQAELDKIAEESKEATDEEIELGSIAPAEVDVAGVTLDGEQVANIFGGISKIYEERTCKGLLNNRNFLEKTSEAIVDIAKIGLLVPNTQVLAVAGGGIALSSILNIINNLFNKRFDFERSSDRQTFIQLNCAFYDIRKDIQKSGFLDVKTSIHEKDKELVKILVKDIEVEVNKLNKSLRAVEKKLRLDRARFFLENIGPIFNLTEVLKKGRSILDSSIVISSDKLFVIRKLALFSPEILKEMENYTNSGGSKVSILDELFKQNISLLDYEKNPEGIRTLVEMDIMEFSNSYLENLKFHFDRLIEDSEKNSDKIEKLWRETTIINNVKLVDYYKSLEKEFDKKEKQISGFYLKMVNVEKRVKRILEEDGFTSTDDGSENIVTILSDYDEIVAQIYGKFGYKFLQYTSKKSIKVNKDFLKKYEKFKENHLNPSSGDQLVPSPEGLKPLRRMFACQDAMPYRRRWKFAESLAQQGYDFVATNSDLFHADIDRVWLGRSGDRFGIHNFLSKYEKIQQHHKSAIFAHKLMTGKTVKPKYVKKYIRKKYLGKAMINVHQSKPKASIIQELIERYDCQKATQMD
jgi:hypothetical protein